MSERTEEIRHQLAAALGTMKRLRDEIRVDLHLANLEARNQWRELEPRMQEAERLARDISETSRKAVEEIISRLRAFRASLQRRAPEQHA